MDLTKYQRIFTEESENYLEALDRLLLEVEENLGARRLWADIHGKIHSIKGMARSLSLESISSLTHLMEDWCRRFRQEPNQATLESVRLLVDGVSLLRLLVAGRGEIVSAQDRRRYNDLTARFKGPAVATPDDGGQGMSAAPLERREPVPIEYVRVRYSLIEELLGLSQEILLLEKMLPPMSYEQMTSGLKSWIEDYTAILRGLHFRLSQLRLMSFADFAELFAPALRSLARENHKKIRLEISGGDLEADITLLERLREPVIHILRNAVAHGIESPDERRRQGKDPAGTIRFAAQRRRDRLVTTISDDGRGIDPEAITRFLRGPRAMTPSAIRALPAAEFYATILDPDFSSAPAISELAGRGIGMNVVAQAIEFLGGSMRIDSQPRRGTTFRLDLPLSLSIIYTLIFRLGDFTLSIPTAHVAAIERRQGDQPQEATGTYDLRRLLGVSPAAACGEHILKIRHPRFSDVLPPSVQSVQIAVDQIIGNQQIMVMPVGELLAHTGYYAGVGIREDGSVTVLLDLENLPLEHPFWSPAPSAAAGRGQT